MPHVLLRLGSVAKLTATTALNTTLEQLPWQLKATSDDGMLRIEDQDNELAAQARRMLI